MRAIYMYILPQKTPVLEELEINGEVGLDSDVAKSESNRNFIFSYYDKIGATFEERYNYIKKHNEDPKLSRQPFFWENPSIKFITKDE